MNLGRWFEKANAYAEAWKRVFSETAPPNAMVLGLAVAQHETLCGDAWPGENNWGAVQLPRRLTPEERAVLAGIAPHPNTVAEARAALAAAGLEEPRGALHADSSPGKGYYFIWFAKFPTEVDGAAHFVSTLAERRVSCRAVLERSSGNESQLAEAMYASHYFEGIHIPNAIYEWDPGTKKWVKTDHGGTPTGETATGADLNVRDYARAMSKWTPQIRVALATWTPGAIVQRPGRQAAFDLSTVLGRQQALNFVGSDPHLVEDGVPGPKTRASTLFFQRAAALSVIDGEWNASTTDAMTACLSTIPGAPRVLSI